MCLLIIRHLAALGIEYLVSFEVSMTSVTRDLGTVEMSRRHLWGLCLVYFSVEIPVGIEQNGNIVCDDRYEITFRYSCLLGIYTENGLRMVIFNVLFIFSAQPSLGYK